jgi:osmoprotectant transport system permease protein
MDVAEAVGMTSWQRLMKVELPLAMPFILAGLRTATVTCVDCHHRSVGAGDWVSYLRGVASVDNRLVLRGPCCVARAGGRCLSDAGMELRVGREAA